MNDMNSYPPQSPQRTPLPYDGLELKNIKQQILKDAYEGQTSNKSPNQSRVNPEKERVKPSEGSIRSSHSLQILPTYEMDRQDSIRNMLKESYDEDISRHQEKKKRDRIQLQQQKDILNVFHQYTTQGPDQNRKQKEEYAKILDQDIERKRVQKAEDKKQLIRQITETDLTRQRRKMGANEKQNSFKEYFSKLNDFRTNVSNDYLKYVENSPKKGVDLRVSQAQQDRQMMQNHKKLMEVQYTKQKKRNQDRKSELRTVLQHQIMENRSFKATEQSQYKNRGYIKKEMTRYNPIYNPIDYQIDLNNKYLIREIVQKQQSQQQRFQ